MGSLKPLRHPNPNMLLRCAQADAYCVSAEFLMSGPNKPTPEREALLGQLRSSLVSGDGRYHGNPGLEIAPGQYTDDTQMSCAVAETVLTRAYLVEESFAEAYHATYHRDQRRGYSKRLTTCLSQPTVQSFRLLTSAATGESSAISEVGCGSAMRAAPLGVLPLARLFPAAEASARVTHDSAIGVFAAQFVAALSHYALYDDGALHQPNVDALLQDWMSYYRSPRTPVAALEAFFKCVFRAPSKEPTTSSAVSVCNAVWDIVSAPDVTLFLALDRILARGGDTDSVAAIAWSILSTRLSYDEKVVPNFLLRDLEPHGTYGRDYLMTLGWQLMNNVGYER